MLILTFNNQNFNVYYGHNVDNLCFIVINVLIICI